MGPSAVPSGRATGVFHLVGARGAGLSGGGNVRGTGRLRPWGLPNQRHRCALRRRDLPAAGRLAGLGVKRLANSLEDCLSILTLGRRTALPRHQTLRATLDWSYLL